MKRLIFTLLFALMIFSSLLYAQSEYASILISTIGSLPNGDMAQKLGDNPRLTRRAGFDIGKDVGLATSGYGAGVELNTPVLTPGLGWIVSFRFLINSTDSKEAEAEFKHLLGDTVDFVYETGNWINFPVMSGFRYKYDLTENFSVAALMQAGINFSRAPSRTGTVDGVVAEKTTFNFTRDFGYEFGFSFEMFKKWNLSFTYLNLNVPRYEGSRYLSEKVFPEIFSNENNILGEERSASMYLISLGYYVF
ncbi:MAG: hypothetical protein GXO74_12085 [Calditrichaeota bacterium]|nr:hypothetical protein [Calditrichota bacterium]